jgi:uncharacterized protein (TIGR00369 family)
MNAESIAIRWLAEEDAVRARLSPRQGFTPPGELAHLTGIEVLESTLAGKLPRVPIAETLDFTLIRVEPGIAVFQGRPQVRHYNPLGSVHGGWFATLLDSAMSCAVQTTLPAGKALTTMEFKVNLVRPLTDSVGVVRAEGKVLNAGRRVAVAEARLVGPDGKLYAHGTTTCLLFDAK